MIDPRAYPYIAVVIILALCLCSCATIHGPQRYTYSLKYPWLTEEIYQICVTESARNELPLSLVLAVIDAESSGRTNAVSKAGALGLCQIMPKYWYSGNPHDLFIPSVNIALGAKIMSYCLRRAHGDLRLALKGYERGFNGKGYNEPYISKIKKNYEAPWRI